MSAVYLLGGLKSPVKTFCVDCGVVRFEVALVTAIHSPATALTTDDNLILVL